MAKSFSPIVLFCDSAPPPSQRLEHDSKDPMDMDIDTSEGRVHSMAIKGSRTSDSASMVSPPSSYSSSSSASLDALAKTMSPARIDVHRKSIQRMIQRNSLLWWELVRYTRNLERKEREQEQEKESEQQLQSEEHPDTPSKPKKAYLANVNGELQSQAHRSREDEDRRVWSLPFDSHEYADQTLERDRTGHARRYSGSGFGYRSISRTPSPSLSPSPSPTRPSFDSAPRVPQSYSHHPSRHLQRQLSDRSRSSQHHRGQGSAEEFPRHPYSQQQQQHPQQQQQPYDPRAGSGYDQEAQALTTAASTPLAKKLPPMDGGSPYPLLPPSPLPSAGLYSSGPSSTASSPRSREQSSSTTTHGYTQHQHQHQHQHPSQAQPQQRDALYQSSYPYQRSYPSLQHDTGPTAYRPRGADHTPHAQDSHRQPHQHSHHHHHLQQQQQQQRRPHSPSRPSSVQHHSSTDSLPRPIPVKPASLHSTSSTTTPLTSCSTHPPDRSSALSPSHPPLAADSNQNNNNNSSSSSAANALNPGGPNNGNVDPNRKRRGNLPKSVTSVLKMWLVQNAIHPYPTEEEKMRLSEETHLSMNQISNWFINARRRILQPILVEAAAAAVAGTDAPVENVLIVRKGKGSRMQVEMEGVSASSSMTAAAASSSANAAAAATTTATTATATATATVSNASTTAATATAPAATTSNTTEGDCVTKQDALLESSPTVSPSVP
ncbi:hypothetical protein BGZ70_004449 [Mortierella alpina]|uniref:Homeobox domain-containing protein n=1 Tax=Mortierella alpina TaxID=64518 RepID=A0A9P6JD73_MORAP|nr:hypothetical protein BGZ70_004449 [Mortierella alpina]